MFTVTFSKKARKYLTKIPPKWQNRIRDKINNIASNPYQINNNIKKILGEEDFYRLRVGDIRVIYSIHNNKLIIEVVDISPRGGVYQ